MADEGATPLPAALQAWLRSAIAAAIPTALAETQPARPSLTVPSLSGAEDSEAGSSPPQTERENPRKRTWSDAPSTSGKGKAPLKRHCVALPPAGSDPDASPSGELVEEYEVLDEYRAGSSGSPPPTDFGRDATPDFPKPTSSGPDQPFEVVDALGCPLFDPRALRHPRSAEWTPSAHIAEFMKFWLRRPLDKEVRQRLRSECPRPTLPAKVSNTPEFDQSFVTFLSGTGRDPRKGIELGLRAAQDKLLDATGPLAQVFQMADEALTEGSPLDAHLVREWIQRAFCLLGNANCAISAERRKAALFKLDAKLADLAPKELGPDANGLLFGEKFIKNLSQHVNVFTSLNKAQTSMKRVFRSGERFSSRAGRQRGRAASRVASGSRPRFPHASTTFRAQDRAPFGRGYARGRGSSTYRGKTPAGRPAAL